MPKPQKVKFEELLSEKAIDLGTIKPLEKDFILYALGISCNLDPMKEADFKYTNEFDSDFSTLPTFSSCFNQKESFKLYIDSPNLPSYGIHQILHAEEKLYMVHDKLIPGATYRITAQHVDVADKGKNAFMTAKISGFTTNSQGKEELAYYIHRNTFFRGLGGFGFKGKGVSPTIPDLPKRKCDLILNDRTFANQAFFYRLSGDPNPLHIDPNIASLAGFDRPIFHGLGTYGICAKNIVQALLGNDPSKIKSYETRFIGHVFPGESFAIQVWKEGNKIFFLAEVVERKTKVVSGVLTIRENAKL